jgi:signal peptidase
MATALAGLRWAAGAIVVAAVVGTVALTAGPRFAPYETYVTRSNGMEPAIGFGSVVIVRPVAPASLAQGDVITYRRAEEPDIIFTRRISQVLAGGESPVVRTKGDASQAEDPWEVQLRGPAWKYVAAVPQVGKLFLYARTGSGQALLVGLPVLLLGGLWLTERGRAGSGSPAGDEDDAEDTEEAADEPRMRARFSGVKNASRGIRP